MSEKTDRTIVEISRREFWNELFDFIAEGGDMISFCRERNLHYPTVARDQYKSPELRARAESARAAGDEYLSEIVRRNLRMFADIDLSKAFDESGNVLLPIKDMPEDIRRALESVEVTEEYAGTGESRAFVGYTKKIRRVSPAKTIELLGKYRKMFTDTIEHSGPDGDAIPFVFLPRKEGSGDEAGEEAPQL